MEIQGTTPYGSYTMTRTKAAEPHGVYAPTTIDAKKGGADFRIIGVGKRAQIIWRDGREERVTDRQLERLQAAHTWATDF